MQQYHSHASNYQKKKKKILNVGKVTKRTDKKKKNIKRDGFIRNIELT